MAPWECLFQHHLNFQKEKLWRRQMELAVSRDDECWCCECNSRSWPCPLHQIHVGVPSINVSRLGMSQQWNAGSNSHYNGVESSQGRQTIWVAVAVIRAAMTYGCAIASASPYHYTSGCKTLIETYRRALEFAKIIWAVSWRCNWAKLNTNCANGKWRPFIYFQFTRDSPRNTGFGHVIYFDWLRVFRVQ